MARPSTEDSEELENLETAAFKMARVLNSGAMLSLRLRQIFMRLYQIERRAPELDWIYPELEALITLAGSDIVDLVDNCDVAHDRIIKILKKRQGTRSEQNRKADYVILVQPTDREEVEA